MKINKLTSFILLVAMILQTTTLSAFASTNSVKSYEYNFGEYKYCVEYFIEQNAVSELLTIYKNNVNLGNIERKVFSDNTSALYVNGVIQDNNISYDYQSFLAAAQGQLLYPKQSLNVKSIAATYPCGYSADHLFPQSSFDSFYVRDANAGAGLGFVLTSTILGFVYKGAAGGVAGGILSIIASITQRADDTGADYIEIYQYKYYVVDAYPGYAMNCFHIRSVGYFYNHITNKRGDKVFDEWNYHQEFI